MPFALAFLITSERDDEEIRQAALRTGAVRGGVARARLRRGNRVLVAPMPAKKKTRQADPDKTINRHALRLLMKETDRGCALVAGAMIDEALGDLLHAAFDDSEIAGRDILDGATAPLKNFGARAQVARALGLIAPYELVVVEDIKWVRNKAAHLIGTDAEPFSFGLEEVMIRTSKITQLYAPEPTATPAERQRWSRLGFVHTVIPMTMRISYYARNIRQARRELTRGAALGSVIDQIAANPKPDNPMFARPGRLDR